MPSESSPSFAKYSLFIFVFAAILLFAFRSSVSSESGVDYYYTFRPALNGWLNGETLYAPPYTGGYSNAPWFLVFLIPLNWLTSRGDEAALFILTISGVIGAWRLFTRGWSGYILPLSFAFCLANLHLFDLLFRSQIDVFVLFSVMLIYVGLKRRQPLVLGAGWVLAGSRPTGILLLLLYSLWMAYREGYLFRALILPMITLIASLVVFGADWMLRWVSMMRLNMGVQPGAWLVTWFRAASILHINPLFPALLTVLLLTITVLTLRTMRAELRFRVAYLVVSSLVIVPYALSYHYSVLLVVFIPVLLHESLLLMIPLYLLTLTPALRIVLGVDFAWLDILFPLTAWIMLTVISLRAKPANALSELQLQ